ncbi:MAG: DUF1499 domain-containing protein [Pseudomonadales bacterium]|nr:DUF1499 domain-containing protein [Pseudomonadales bacterium]
MTGLTRVITIFMFILIGLLFVIFAGFSYLGYQSRNMNMGYQLVNGKLKACPPKPNCINTDAPSSAQGIEPVNLQALHIDNLQPKLIETIEKTGGAIVYATPQHIAAIYQSRLFGFVDDLEIRIDNKSHQVFFRSASRVGHNDLQANHNRVKNIIKQLSANKAVQE